MSEKDIQNWLETFQSSRTWLSKRYSPERIRSALESWAAFFRAEAEAEGLPMEGIEPLDHFRPSYLRLSLGVEHNGQLKSRARAAVQRISKHLLLEQVRQVAGNEALDAARLEKWSHQRIASRFGAWQRAVREAVPDLPREEVFRFFRLRYLYLTEERFASQAIPLGVKNTVEYNERITVLGRLGIDAAHPEYNRWLSMAPWQFQRVAKKLEQALERFWMNRLGFPPTSESINQRDYERYLKVCANGERPGLHEEMVYKLLLYFDGMTREQLIALLSRAPEGTVWRTYDLDGALAHLVELGLIEELGSDELPSYQPSRSIQTELILETWLRKLRSQIKIGTQEALEYLPNGYQRHQMCVIAERDIPRATELIMRDRRRLVSELGIDRNDPRYQRLIGMSRREIEAEIETFRSVVQAFEKHDLGLSREIEKQFDIFFEEDLKPGDRDVFVLIVSLGTVSMSQIARILRRHGGKRKGFALKSSLKRLCSVELLSQNRNGLYSLHPALRNLGETEKTTELTRVVGFF